MTSINVLSTSRRPVPVCHLQPVSRIRPSLLVLDGLHGSGHPDPDFRPQSPQHNQQPCSRSTSRRKTSCQGFHESNR